MNRRTLRFSLVTSMVALAAAGLLVTCGTAAVALRSYLLERTDEQLAAAAVLVRQRAATLTPEGPELRSVVSVTEYLIEYRRADGGTIRFESGSPLPADPLLDRADPAATRTQTVTGTSGERYRAIVVPVAGDARVLVGLPLAPIRNTLVRFTAIAALTGAVVLLLLTLLARWLVARRLRPLDEIGAAATAIAAGDLDRRAGAPPPGSAAARTEVGRLATAVDRMLTRIQAAMTARERSEQRMRAFVADASHELRTPVTSISGYLQLIRTGVIDLGRRPDVLRRIEEEAGRIGALVGDLLYLARLDAGPPARRVPVDLAALIRDAVADARAVEPDRPLTASVPETLTVTGDPDTLRQVLANLLGNVRAHTPPGTPARVSAVLSGDRVRVATRDEGPGMTAAEAAHAFERFWRAEGSRARSDGAGLGLAIVAEAVRAHHGETGVETAPGRGATVWFELPRS
ncbi:two-component system OmpR family sensor kinase [Actinoplanes octamycinicus]|uniref:histidine kinase n=1 Tax=Actinoplanes octamycinicus TaxID=135948 RepID=A0A7W7GY76_9ACTN|nr:HAMP domain-containing sensor histidine kinase [Actinoplanes octamycinicus]MBB4740481.1 two-component system OmpR family sensor kinase [Actinoplanes octamycinicus]GIE59741.1 two-component sensor histidine kinase [Actinoplanes octamycinicus]